MPENFSKFNEKPKESVHDILQDRAHNCFAATRATFELSESGHWNYQERRSGLIQSTRIKTEALRSICPQLSEDDAKIVEDFCQLADQTPSEVDYEYLTKLEEKLEVINKVIDRLGK